MFHKERNRFTHFIIVTGMNQYITIHIKKLLTILIYNFLYLIVIVYHNHKEQLYGRTEIRIKHYTVLSSFFLSLSFFFLNVNKI